MQTKENYYYLFVCIFVPLYHQELSIDSIIIKISNTRTLAIPFPVHHQSVFTNLDFLHFY